jgi:hypothetical protein
MFYYYVNLYVGNPPKKQALIVDTGSHITAIPCKPLCISCGNHINSYYSMKGINNLFNLIILYNIILDSKTSKIVECKSDQCNVFPMRSCADNNKCGFSVVIIDI